MKAQRRFQRFGLHDWQLNIGRFQFNWTGRAKDFPWLSWGLRVWKDHIHWFDLMRHPRDKVRCANCLRLGHHWKACPDAYFNKKG